MSSFCERCAARLPGPRIVVGDLCLRCRRKDRKVKLAIAAVLILAIHALLFWSLFSN